MVSEPVSFEVKAEIASTFFDFDVRPNTDSGVIPHSGELALLLLFPTQMSGTYKDSFSLLAMLNIRVLRGVTKVMAF